VGQSCRLRSFSETIVWWDQDLLNAVLRDEIVLLHPKWNLQSHIFQDGSYGYYSKDQIEEAISDPAIVHFSTDVKHGAPIVDTPAKISISNIFI